MAATNIQIFCISPDYVMLKSWKDSRHITDDSICYLYSYHKIFLCLYGSLVHQGFHLPPEMVIQWCQVRWARRPGYSCCWVLWCSLTSQAISLVFYIEREKSDKFCSESLISAWDSFMCHKSTTWDQWLYFPSEGSHTQDFYILKKSIDPGWVWTHEPRIQWRVW